MKKNFLGILGAIAVSFLCVSVNAEETCFVNTNGVVLTKKEYEFVNKFYFDGFAEKMTKRDYQEFITNDVMNGEIKTVEYEEYVNNGISLLASTDYATKSKKITLSSSCTDTCFINIYVDWFTNPKVRSYDLLGAYFENTEYVGGIVTHLYYDTGAKTITDANKASNGIAATVKLPTSVTGISMRQSFTVKKKGRIYASYQHASSTISLANSKKYSFSKAGVANVFLFQSGIAKYYDQMNGVNLGLS